MKPILTIAIPTYNRAGYLKETLESIVLQTRFQDTSDVEIVVSDNCSTDDTRAVTHSFIGIYGDKIKYFCNAENIKDGNMEASLSRGNGEFLKLNNDTLKHLPNSLNSILSLIARHREARNIIFFLNQSINKRESILCNSFEEFIETSSYYITWIGSFGIWKDDFDSFCDFSRYAKLQLPQTDVLCRLLCENRKAFVNNDLLFISIKLTQKGGYDLITVFLDNLSFIIYEYVQAGYLSTKGYKKFLYSLLTAFLCDVFVDITLNKNNYSFEHKNAVSRIYVFYKKYPLALLVFYCKYAFTLSFKFCLRIIKEILRSIKRSFD